MPRKKILWLCSWYPGKFSPYNGDFIQRHAQAAALYNDIYVIHIYGSPHAEKGKPVTERITHDHLTEHLVYFQKGNRSRWLAGYHWLRLGKRAIREYISRHGRPDLVHVHIPVKSGLLALWMRKKFKTEFVVSEHWGIYNDVVEDRYEKKNTAFRRLTTMIIEKASRFLSVSNFLAQGVNEKVIRKDYTVVPNVVNTGLFKLHEPTDRQVTRFIHVSNMIDLKNPEGILRAFRLFLQKRQDVELVMVGDQDPAIRQVATDLGMQAFVEFTGEIAYAAVAEKMAGAHALVHFSDMENSPCVIGEALCCGLPVIATAVGGIPELVTEENGRLVQPRDIEGLCEAMDSMVTGYTEFDRESIAKDAAKKFSYGVIGKMFDNVYESVLRKT
jgi:glycosyltransferase involved in cell wall biosynthesis